ncbi:NmrA domain-containing protein [Mycena venus]|uniref:NmrA domain-containing protein n=1 Tax=Mycena venus TaxID=2733690 RepID=A0A8H6TZI1_9AGAR|nr:NmrA domain-containing protein [Mycena venus]
MSFPQKVLFIGATGYIGGTVLGKLLQHPRVTNLHVTAFVRDPAKAEKLEAFGVTPVIGDNSKLELLEALAQDADVVFSVANSDDVPAVKAALAGAKKRFESTGRPTTFIHTSGAGIIADCTVNGAHHDSPIFDDLDETQMATISPMQLHRPVDLELLDADDQGYIKSYIIVPTTVWGIPSGPLLDAGIQKWQNGILNFLVPASVARGQGGMVGEGRNVWNNVEVNELADLYILLYNAIMANEETAHGRVGLYFAENGAYELSEMSAVIARVLFEHGKGGSPIPTSFTAEEVEKMGLIAMLIASNAKCTASRARALGWRPTKSTREMLDCVRGGDDKTCWSRAQHLMETVWRSRTP